MKNSNPRAETAHLLVPEPPTLTEQEIDMEALAEVLYGIFTRQQAEKESAKPVVSIDSPLSSPRVFAPASIAVN